MPLPPVTSAVNVRHLNIASRPPISFVRLRFLNDLESDHGATDNEHTTYMLYVIKWRVTLNNQVLAKDTEQDLVLRPGSYWQQIKQKAKHVLC